jgi:hypothetical protein
MKCVKTKDGSEDSIVLQIQTLVRVPEFYKIPEVYRIPGILWNTILLEYQYSMEYYIPWDTVFYRILFNTIQYWQQYFCGIQYRQFGIPPTTSSN